MTYADESAVTLSWLPPLNTAQSRSECNSCHGDGMFEQYAIEGSMIGAEHYDVVALESGPVHATGKQRDSIDNSAISSPLNENIKGHWL